MPAVTVKGMSCNHCRQAVTEALQAIPGVTVDLATGEAAWKETQPVDVAEVKKAIVKLGFEVQ